MWERQLTLARDGHVSVLSVDIGDFNTPSRHLVDGVRARQGCADCTADEIAGGVAPNRAAVTGDAEHVPEALLPWPAWMRWTAT